MPSHTKQSFTSRVRCHHAERISSKITENRKRQPVVLPPLENVAVLLFVSQALRSTEFHAHVTFIFIESPFSYPHKNFLSRAATHQVERAPTRNRTHSSTGSRTYPTNVGTRNPRGLTRPGLAQDSGAGVSKLFCPRPLSMAFPVVSDDQFGDDCSLWCTFGSNMLVCHVEGSAREHAAVPVVPSFPYLCWVPLNLVLESPCSGVWGDRQVVEQRVVAHTRYPSEADHLPFWHMATPA